MNKLIFLVISSFAAAIVMSSGAVTRYYIGNAEVPESLWISIPDSLRWSTAEFDFDSVSVKVVELPLTHYLDSTAGDGGYKIVARSEEQVAAMEEALGRMVVQYRSRTLSANVGEAAPQIDLVLYRDSMLCADFIREGECYLLSFWATWCGNCLLELQEEYVPSVVKRFSENPHFKFVPICIDVAVSDLNRFFASSRGKRWEYLADITYLDSHRIANGKFGQSGVMPLNVVIGRDGAVKYIHSGVLTSRESLDELEAVINQNL